MIAKVEVEVKVEVVEESPVVNGTSLAPWQGVEKYEAVLRTRKPQLEESCSQHGLPKESILKTVWALLLHTYRSVSVVDFCQIDSRSGTVGTYHVQLEEQQSLLDLCKQIDCLLIDQPVKGGPYSTAIFLDGLHAANGYSTAKPSKANDVRASLSDLELVAAVRAEKGELSLSLFFNKDRISKPSVVGYWHTFEKILDTLLQDCYQKLHCADFLSDHDRNQLIAWNKPVPERPEDLTVCGEFAGHVRRQPKAAAVYAWDGQMTYEELDQISSRVAASLSAFGVSPRSIVPFCMEKTKWALVAALSILKAGAALVPMDPEWPEQRTSTILNTTEATVVLCSPETSSCFDELPVRTFQLSATIFEAMKEDRELPRGPLTNDVSFILFSSGSTGVPKGMVREHGTTCIASIAHAKAMHIDSKSRVLQFANHVFDVAMLAGGCVCIPSESDRRNDLAGFIQRSQANWALLTPTVASMLDPTTVPSLRDMTLGGEAITPELLNKWLGHCRVGINYGSAEVDVTHARDVEDPKDPSSVGKRLSSCVTYIVDPENVNKILPIGAVGELLISGPTMARSYLKNPEKTAASFIKAPVDWYFNEPDGRIKPWMTRAYRMGDLLQQQWDGSFKFIGRRDFQIKVHGQKVELGEIESQLSTHHQVYRCAVIYPRSGPFADRLVAVVELKGSSPEARRRGNTTSKAAPRLGVEAIKQYLSERVPTYMLPQVSILAMPMPLTATMKVDRTKLMTWITENDPLLASSHALTSISTALKGEMLRVDETVALNISTSIADLVAAKSSQIWTAVQGHDNLLADIGIDSVQTMRLSSIILKTYNRKIPVEMLTDRHLTVRQLARIIEMDSTICSGPARGDMTGDMLKMHLKKALSNVQMACRAGRPAWPSTTDEQSQGQQESPCNVFLTGVTGYLGIQILRALLESSKVGTVHVLVRSADVSQAQARIAATALAANWSVKPYNHRINIWPGDLSQPQLGLQNSAWTRLTKDDASGSRINSIIHCGAVVDWTKSFERLEAANVTSTVQLLNLALGSQSISHFVYISGGQYFQPGPDDGQLDQRFSEAAAGNGYAQTKFVAEQLVDIVRRQLIDAHSNLDVSTIKPAYLIGSERDGLANVDDYLWRLVSAATQLNTYNQEEASQWLLAADSSCVARAIIETATAVTTTDAISSGTACIKICDGIPLDRFWTIVGEETGRVLRGVSGTEWTTGVKEAMEAYAAHPLWPLLEAFDKNAGLLTGMTIASRDMQGPNAKVQYTIVEDAVRRNVRYLVGIGFLPGSK